MKTVVMTGADSRMAAIHEITVPGKRSWAARHGYEFLEITDWEPEPVIVWQKMQRIYDEAKRRFSERQQILWLDADALITNPALSMADLLPDDERTVLFASRDWDECPPEDEPHYFNTGNMVVRWGFGFDDLFDAMFERGARDYWTEWGYEQSTLQDITRYDDLGALIRVLPGQALNAVPRELHARTRNPWQQSNFLAHLTGVSNAERLAFLQSPWMKDEYRR